MQKEAGSDRDEVSETETNEAFLGKAGPRCSLPDRSEQMMVGAPIKDLDAERAGRLSGYCREEG